VSRPALGPTRLLSPRGLSGRGRKADHPPSSRT
jgi:hypothetical protein